MRKSFLKSTFALLLIAGIATSCGPSLKITSKPIGNDISNSPEKNAKLDEDQRKKWPDMDMVADTVPGMSIRKAYAQIIKDHKGKTVIVAVVDAGVDIEHEDLKDIIWTNKKEIPGNGIDDDNNGYVDDVHGWNFLGKAVHENLEYVRILKKLKPKYEDKTASDISPADKDEFALYQRAKKKYDEAYPKAKQTADYLGSLKPKFEEAKKMVIKKMGGEDFTKSELSDMEADTAEMKQSKAIVLGIMSQAGLDNGKQLDEVSDQLDKGYTYYNDQLKYHLNLDFNGRKVVGDNVDDITDTDYGNNDVDGPTEDKEDVMHGTHVAGIIAAVRNNGIGMNGVANNVQIMPVRAVPDGDEYDKDIALAIRYAVDNGAKIINTSFGKYFSTHPDWVNDAIRYAAKHDVLIVNASGNDGKDLDETRVYPNDQWPGHEDEISDNLLSIGALNYHYGKDLIASFSNYGKTNVDVFSPGVQIWSTTPLNEYKFLAGTSMAAPEVAGVAAVIRSYYPKLTASQVKHIIMNSGLSTSKEVILGGDPSNTKPFDEISVSGKMVNLYNALIMASKM